MGEELAGSEVAGHRDRRGTRGRGTRGRGGRAVALSYRVPDLGPLELEPATDPKPIVPAREPSMFVPPRVKIVAVEDQRRCEPTTDVATLTSFYCGLLGFHPESPTTYRAEKHCLRFDLPEAQAGGEVLPPVGVRVPVELRALEKTLTEDWRLEVERVTTLWPGSDALLLEAPGGTLLALGEYRELL